MGVVMDRDTLYKRCWQWWYVDRRGFEGNTIEHMGRVPNEGERNMRYFKVQLEGWSSTSSIYPPEHRGYEEKSEQDPQRLGELDAFLISHGW